MHWYLDAPKKHTVFSPPAATTAGRLAFVSGRVAVAASVPAGASLAAPARRAPGHPRGVPREFGVDWPDVARSAWYMPVAGIQAAGDVRNELIETEAVVALPKPPGGGT